MLRFGISCTLALLANVVGAQTPPLVSSVFPSLENVAGSGTAVLDVAVVFPVTSTGAVVPPTGGWPVIVFLHGFNLLGYDYYEFGLALAAEGFVVVLANTARANYFELNEDARSLPAALEAWNATPGHLLTGALDVDRMGLMGHSMGGGVTGMTLARCDQYRCGLALSPVFPGPWVAGAVTVPFGILVGAGDTVTPYDVHSTPYLQSLGTQEGLRFLYLMDGRVDHMNIAGIQPAGWSPIATRTVQLTASWFHQMLEAAPTGLEQVLGQAAILDPYRLGSTHQVFVPQSWIAAPARIGRPVRISIAAEYGLGGALAAASTTGGLPTTFGTLYLDPASVFGLGFGLALDDGRLDLTLQVPNNVNLIGAQLPIQGLGVASNEPILLGSPFVLTVGP